jgi:hypothetical protein
MPQTAPLPAPRLGPLARRLLWGGAGALLLLPLLGMQLSDEWRWSGFDLALFAGLLIGPALVLELAARRSASRRYRAGAALALLAAFGLIWVNLAVGVIGHEGNPLNLMFAGVVGLGAAGALLARLHPRGLARALAAMALAQLAVGLVAAVLGHPIWIVTGVFTLAWAASAWLVHGAGRA